MLTKQMRLDAIDHVTGITADGQRCLDFYAGVLGLPFVGRFRDFESPASHLASLAPEPGRPHGVLSFIEAPGLGRGRAGNGMIHTLRWSLPTAASIRYWAGRLAEAGINAHPLADDRDGAGLRFTDPEGLAHELVTSGEVPDSPLPTHSSTVPAEHAIRGLAGVRAYGRQSVPSADILAGRLGFKVTGPDAYEVLGTDRATAFAFDEPPTVRPSLGAGTIHHVAWAGEGSLSAWRQRVIGMGCRATPVIDRGHCSSVYFREPSGVLFEITAREPGQARNGHETEAERRLSPRVDPRVRSVLV
jgi:glyoxalase family protein